MMDPLALAARINVRPQLPSARREPLRQLCLAYRGLRFPVVGCIGETGPDFCVLSGFGRFPRYSGFGGLFLLLL